MMLATHWLRETQYGLVVGLTLLISATGLGLLGAHMYIAGVPGHTPSSWPGESRLTMERAGLTALLFVHPLCPCTVTAVSELDQFLRETNRSLRVQIVQAQPGDGARALGSGSLVRRVQANRHFVLLNDYGAQECNRFGVTTSGHLMVFDERGQKLIDGGLTNGRGQVGPSAGLHALEAVLAGKRPSVTQFPVYGCSLLMTAE